MKIVIASQRRRETALLQIREATLDASHDRQYVITVEKLKMDRTDAQRRLSHLWYKQLGEQTGHGHEYERRHCKWNFGFPVLLQRDPPDEDINRFYRTLVYKLTYEERVAAMQYTDVTSLFKVKEFSEYLNTIERYAAEMGYHLTFPDDQYDLAMGRRRKGTKGGEK
jgi:hypothetical protein